MKPEELKPIITVHGSNVHLGDILPKRARECVERVAGKYFGRLNAAAVYFSRDGQTYRCTVNMQVAALKQMTGESVHEDCYKALDLAIEKIAKQLRRKKRELREDKPVRLKDRQLAAVAHAAY